MSKYEINFIEHRYMAGGCWASVFQVLTLKDDGSGHDVPNVFYIAVDNEYLNIYDTPINPFDIELINHGEAVIPVDSFELRHCYVDYVIENVPSFAYLDYDDPVVFLDEDLEGIDSRNILFLACWYRWKFEMNKRGYC